MKWIKRTAGEHVCVCGSFSWPQTCFIYSSLYSKHLCAAAIMLRETFFSHTCAYEHDLKAHMHWRKKHSGHGMCLFFKDSNV